MGITKESGDIILLNPENESVKVASIQHGISFSKTLKHRKVVRVTIYSLDGALSDEFYFAPGEKDWEILFGLVVQALTLEHCMFPTQKLAV